VASQRREKFGAQSHEELGEEKKKGEGKRKSPFAVRRGGVLMRKVKTQPLFSPTRGLPKGGEGSNL